MAYNPLNPNGQATMANSEPVVIASDQSAVPVKDNDTLASGTISALNGTVTITLDDRAATTMDIRGTWIGTITFQGSVDGTNYVPIWGFLAGDQQIYSSISGSQSNQIYRFTTAGFVKVRAIMTAYTSGTATITMRSSLATSGVYLNFPEVTALESSVNSTTTPLGIGGVFTGNAEDLLNYVGVNISVYSDQASAVNGLSVQFSPDGTNWDQITTYSISAATGFITFANTDSRYFRIVYTNGSIAQTVFRLKCIKRNIIEIGEVTSAGTNVADSQNTILTKSIIVGKTTAGGNAYVPVKVNPSGTLASDVSNSTNLSIANGLVVTSNSTTTPLGPGATFTGSSIDTFGYSTIEVLVASDKDSAANGFNIQYSGDGINWDEATVATYTTGSVPNVGQVYGGGIRARYARIVYTNGAIAQTYFRLATTLKTTSSAADMVDVETALGANTHAIVTKSVISGKTTGGGGSWVDVKVNPSGTLTVDSTIKNIAGTQINPATEDGNLANLAPSTLAPIHFQTTVTTAGTRVQLAANACKWVIIKAKATNTGNIFVGGVTVTSTNGYILTPGEAISFDGTNTNLFYIDSSVSGEGVSIIARN